MAKKPAIVSFTKTLAAKREEVREARARVDRIAKYADDFAPAFLIADQAAKAAALHECGKYATAEPSVYERWDGSVELMLHVSFEGSVASLKEGAVPAVVDAIMALGFDATETRDYASEWSASRDFKFRVQVGKVDVKVNFCANVRDGSPTCRRVQVGTEIKETPKYQIVCE